MLSEGKDIGAVCKALEVSEAMFHCRRNQFAVLTASRAVQRRRGDRRIVGVPNDFRDVQP